MEGGLCSTLDGTSGCGEHLSYHQSHLWKVKYVDSRIGSSLSNLQNLHSICTSSEEVAANKPLHLKSLESMTAYQVLLRRKQTLPCAAAVQSHRRWLSSRSFPLPIVRSLFLQQLCALSWFQANLGCSTVFLLNNCARTFLLCGPAAEMPS